ncbi:hypothetical protein ACFUCV_02835 [Specibacter sp. NPDC057265]|uniref:hypothetical protein n=1 Tax=Specibacter sp. NPDC057265 TaxID=3346075 RepID=UPI00362C0DBB
MHSTDDQAAIPTATEADAWEQGIPAVPTAQAEAAAQGSTPPATDALLPDGSEADRLDQHADGGEVDAGDEEYPRDTSEAP